MIILMLLLGRFFEWPMNFKRMRQEYERYRGKYSKIHTLLPASVSTSTCIGIFILDSGRSTNNYKKFISSFFY